MKDLLKLLDKDIFQLVKDRKLTFDQLKSRLYEKASKEKDYKYYCFDDLKDKLYEEL